MPFSLSFFLPGLGDKQNTFFPLKKLILLVFLKNQSIHTECIMSVSLLDFAFKGKSHDSPNYTRVVVNII